jgi:hypothetical protein
MSSVQCVAFIFLHKQSQTISASHNIIGNTAKHSSGYKNTAHHLQAMVTAATERYPEEQTKEN